MVRQLAAAPFAVAVIVGGLASLFTARVARAITSPGGMVLGSVAPASCWRRERR